MRTLADRRSTAAAALGDPTRARGAGRALARAETRHLLRPGAGSRRRRHHHDPRRRDRDGRVDFSALALSGLACLPLGIGTFVATTVASRRDTRSRTEELLDALPEPATARTAGQLMSIAAAAGVAVMAVAVATIVVIALGGPEVRFSTGVERQVPTLAELSQGPVAVAVGGLAASIALASHRVTPARAAVSAGMLVVAVLGGLLQLR